jgi:hypothetical protein
VVVATSASHLAATDVAPEADGDAGEEVLA